MHKLHTTDDTYANLGAMMHGWIDIDTTKRKTVQLICGI